MGHSKRAGNKPARNACPANGTAALCRQQHRISVLDALGGGVVYVDVHWVVEGLA